jgi:hypothetical protein
MLDIRVRISIGIDIIVLRRNVMVWIVSRHDYIVLQDRRRDGVILIVDGDGRLAER